MNPDDYRKIMEKFCQSAYTVAEATDMLAKSMAKASFPGLEHYGRGRGETLSEWEKDEERRNDPRAKRVKGKDGSEVSEEERAQRATKGQDPAQTVDRDAHLSVLKSQMRTAMLEYDVGLGDLLDLLKGVALEAQDELAFQIEDADDAS